MIRRDSKLSRQVIIALVAIAAISLLAVFAKLFEERSGVAEIEDAIPPASEETQAFLNPQAELSPTETIARPIIASASQNGVTVSILWVYADERRVAIEYLVEGRETPAGFMLPCPVFRALLSEGDFRYPEYRYAEPINAIRTRCYDSGQGIFAVTQNFYRNLDKDRVLDLGFDITIGGMTLFTEDGATMKYPQAGVFHFELSAVSDGQWTIEPRQMVEKNKITTTLRKMEFNPSVVDAELCLQFDNDWEWIPEATLLINNSQSKAEWTEQIDEEGNLYIAISPNRCFRFTFPVEGDLESGAPIAIELEKLKIDAFNVLTDEGCSETLLAIQQNYPDVNFACHIDFRDGGRSVGFELLSKPASMSDGQVYELFRAALQEEIEGPWRFEVNVP